jgi:hypothetical protein
MLSAQTNPSSFLHAKYPDEVTVSSISLWNQATAVPLVWSSEQLNGSYVIVHGNKTSTGCAIGPIVAAKPGFAGLKLVCGVSGSRISMAFPKILEGGNSQVAVRVCTVRPDNVTSNQGTLFVQVKEGVLL